MPSALTMANAYAFAAQHARINDRDRIELKRLQLIERMLWRLDDRDRDRAA